MAKKRKKKTLSKRKRVPIPKHAPDEIILDGSLRSVGEAGAAVAALARDEGYSFEGIAESAGCCAATVSRLAHQDVKAPQYRTMIGILGTVGYRQTATRE